MGSAGRRGVAARSGEIWRRLGCAGSVPWLGDFLPPKVYIVMAGHGKVVSNGAAVSRGIIRALAVQRRAHGAAARGRTPC